MDFPKSVPGAGLVGGLFVDENQATGQPGSLMAASWGNAVTQELLNIIRAAGLEPDEAKTNQVLEAIRALVPERSAFARRVGTNNLPADAFGIFALADGGAAATITLPSTVDLVGDTELLLFSNHANTAALQIKTAVGQTVQGPAALMGASTTAFMLPLGGDWVRLRSEKAQARWVIVACYPAGVAAQMLQLQNKVAVLETRDFGVSTQQWVTTTTTRLPNVPYVADQTFLLRLEANVASVTAGSILSIYTINGEDFLGATQPYGSSAQYVSEMLISKGATFSYRLTGSPNASTLKVREFRRGA